MIIVRLKGGMGNQMFQYAFGKSMATRLNTQLLIDCSLLLDRSRGKEHIYRNYDLTLFKVEENFTFSLKALNLIYKLKSSAIRKFMTSYVARGVRVLKEKHFHTDSDLIEVPQDNTLYDGWWQSRFYFENIEEILRKEFKFKKDILDVSLPVYDEIRQSNSVCLNVRRTDFLTNSTLNATNLEYFMNAAKKMNELVENPHFFIFSDDMEWCKKNILLKQPTTYVQHDMKGEKFGNYLQLMIACQHFIIPNSSFAWWAVWLNENKNKRVIAPKKWFNEGDYDTRGLISDDWIRL